MSDNITFDDCCRLLLENGPRGSASPSARYPNYRRDLLVLLNREFGIQWEDNDKYNYSLPSDERVPPITSKLVREYYSIEDPFDCWIEYAFRRGEMAVWTAHREVMRETVTALRQRYVEFFRDLLLLRWPSAASCSTSWERLRELGLIVPVYDPDWF